MRRSVEQQLIEWKNRERRLPLLVRGARQVGKSHLVESFGNQHFENLLVVNFEYEPSYSRCFESLDPKDILQKLTIQSGKQLIPGQSLLFLDEIQECPQAILSLRYFKEKMPDLHVIGAGSLLEFALNDERFRMPVGRVQFLHLRPLSFKEFLENSEQRHLADHLSTVSLKTGVDPVAHSSLLPLVRQYFALGGMPGVLSEFFQNHDTQLSQELQTGLLTTYRGDFGKYASQSHQKYLKTLFEQAPRLIAQRFRFVDVDPEARSRNIKPALDNLCDAGLIRLIYASSASTPPLEAKIHEKRFKLLFLDIGLVKRACGLEIQPFFEEDLVLLNRGALAEQFVGQELAAYASPWELAKLYYWEREKAKSAAEVDYLVSNGRSIFPLEVKAGATGRLRSMQQYISEKKAPGGIRVSQKTLSFEKNILSVPFYLLSELPRLIQKAWPDAFYIEPD